MKNVIIFSMFLVFLLGCQPDKSNVEKHNDSVSDTTMVQDSLKDGKNFNTAFFVGPSGDTTYFDYEVKFSTAPETEQNKNLEKYFIVASYSSYQNDDKFQEEFKRWKDLEPMCKIETFGTGAGRKYYISLAKNKSRAEIIPFFEDFKTKYPEEKINFYSIVQ